MVDDTNDQRNFHQSADQQSDIPQNTLHESVNERTYWETNSFNPTAEEPAPEQQSLEQFFQYYQEQLKIQAADQQNDEQQKYNPRLSSFYSQSPYDQPPNNCRKKSHAAVIVILAVLLILGIASATVYAFKDTLMNSFMKMTKSPLEYYIYIENNNVGDMINGITQVMDKSAKEKEKYAYNITTDISVNDDAVNSVLQSGLGMSLTDLESAVGIPFDSVGVDALLSMDGNIMNQTLGLRLNNVNLITAELFINYASNETLLRLPDLSEAYLRMPEGTAGNINRSSADLITTERTADFLKRYSNIFLNNINQVTLAEDAELSLNKLSSDCTKLIVTISSEDMHRMGNQILEEAKDDPYMFDLLAVYHITEESYLGYIDDAQAELDNYYNTADVENLQMIIYVDSKGNILGRKITSEDTVASIGYTLLIEGVNAEYNIFLTDDTGASLLDIEGNRTWNNGAFDGKAKVTLHSTDEASSDFSFDITYEDFRTEEINGRDYPFGNITLSSLDLDGLQIIMDFSAENEISLCRIVFQMGAEALVTANIKSRFINNYEVTFPAGYAQIYDFNEAESYMSTFNLNNYISDLSDRFGVDLKSLYDNYFSGSFD